MDLEIQEILEDNYRNIEILVEYLSLNKYSIKIGIKKDDIIYESQIIFYYNRKLTIDANVDKIKNVIDNIILSFFYYRKGDKNGKSNYI